MSAIMPVHFYHEVLKKLFPNLPAKPTRVVITVEMNTPVRMEVTSLVDTDELTPEEVTQTYHLTLPEED